MTPLLVGVRELGEFLRIGTAIPESAEAQIRTAQALVESELNGDLYERVIQQERYRPLYDIEPPYGLETRSGPISSVQGLTYSNTEIDLADLRIGLWSIHRETTFRSRSVILLDYTVGYHRHETDSSGTVIPNEGNVPDPIREAILGIAGELYLHPDGALQSEKIGDYHYTMRIPGFGLGELPALTPKTKLLLKRYKRTAV